MNLDFVSLQPDYTQRLAEMAPIRQAAAVAEAKALLKYRDRFLALQAQCGVPALWVMPVFYRESPTFTSYLGNGDPLDRPTRDVPRGRGHFDSWEAGAADALAFDHVTQCPRWDWEHACWEWEKYNGFGVREHGRTSGYLWSGTDQYHGGKYVADGVWSRGTYDTQLGTVLIAKAIAALDEEIAKGFAT